MNLIISPLSGASLQLLQRALWAISNKVITSFKLFGLSNIYIYYFLNSILLYATPLPLLESVMVSQVKLWNYSKKDVLSSFLGNNIEAMTKTGLYVISPDLIHLEKKPVSSQLWNISSPVVCLQLERPKDSDMMRQKQLGLGVTKLC